MMACIEPDAARARPSVERNLATGDHLSGPLPFLTLRSKSRSGRDKPDAHAPKLTFERHLVTGMSDPSGMKPDNIASAAPIVPQKEMKSHVPSRK